MEKSKNLKDSEQRNKLLKLMAQEISHFKSLIKGHQKILEAIGDL